MYYNNLTSHFVPGGFLRITDEEFITVPLETITNTPSKANALLQEVL